MKDRKEAKQPAQRAIIVRHKTKPGMRDRVQAIWQKHMQPAIVENQGHVAYFYCMSPEPDSIVAFQCYSDPQAASEFLKSDAYAAYHAEVAPLLLGDPLVDVADVVWSKPTVTAPLAARKAS